MGVLLRKPFHEKRTAKTPKITQAALSTGSMVAKVRRQTEGGSLERGKRAGGLSGPTRPRPEHGHQARYGGGGGRKLPKGPKDIHAGLKPGSAVQKQPSWPAFVQRHDALCHRASMLMSSKAYITPAPIEQVTCTISQCCQGRVSHIPLRGPAQNNLGPSELNAGTVVSCTHYRGALVPLVRNAPTPPHSPIITTPLNRPHRTACMGQADS